MIEFSEELIDGEVYIRGKWKERSDFWYFCKRDIHEEMDREFRRIWNEYERKFFFGEDYKTK